jgi:hypothetical protein
LSGRQLIALLFKKCTLALPKPTATASTFSLFTMAVYTPKKEMQIPQFIPHGNFPFRMDNQVMKHHLHCLALGLKIYIPTQRELIKWN